MSAISLRYANAFAGVARAMHLDAGMVQQQLRDFAGTLSDSRDLREVLANPSVTSEAKLRVLDALAARIGMYPQVRNFIAVILDHQRLAAFEEIVADYVEVADATAGVIRAEITSTRELGESERSELEAGITQVAGGRISATYRLDAGLLGGVLVRVGSTVYDGSVRGQLSRLKRSLIVAT